jgi:hypothetical protein
MAIKERKISFKNETPTVCFQVMSIKVVSLYFDKMCLENFHSWKKAYSMAEVDLVSGMNSQNNVT